MAKGKEGMTEASTRYNNDGNNRNRNELDFGSLCHLSLVLGRPTPCMPRVDDVVVIIVVLTSLCVDHKSLARG